MTPPELAQLHQLRRLGFRDQPILDDAGQVAIVYCVREVPGWREVVLVYGGGGARAYRIRPPGPADNPLRIDPAAVDRLIPPGDVVTVVHALLNGSPAGGDS